MKTKPHNKQIEPLRRALVGVSLITLLLAGCSERSDSLAVNDGQGEGELAGEGSQLSSVVEFGRPEGVEGASGALSLEERQEQLQSLLGQAISFNKAVSEASNWQEADREVKALLDLRSSAVPQYRREQQAADAMLKHWLIKGERTTEKQEATAFYVDNLLENRSPQSALILSALEQLDGYWSESRLVEAARVTAQAAEGLVARKTSCEDCAAKQLQDALPRQIQSEHDLHLHQTLEAAEELRAISRGE